MAFVECPREQDVIDAIAADRWPARCEEDLRGHVAACRLCADLVEVVAPLRVDGGDLPSAAALPAAGTVWWRAQTRARREAAREAAGPVTVAQVVGFFSALLALTTLVWAAAPWLSGFIAMLPDLPSIDVGVISLPEPAELVRWRWVIAAIVAWLVLAPLALYFAIEED